jgi:urocanate hydratase
MPSFKEQVAAGIPSELPEMPVHDEEVSHAPARPLLISDQEKHLAVANALRYFPVDLHPRLAPEFAQELARDGRIYMRRFRPRYEMHARPIHEYPAKSKEAAAIMLMIQNNLDPAVAQHPHELITYGGNGTVFQNWAQYLLTMHYLARMTNEQTLVMYSGHPLGLFPSSPHNPRVVVTNGMTVPNYSSPDDYIKMASLGTTSYGQMTAGSYMYIGPQGIVHGTTITLLNAGRKYLGLDPESNLGGKVFVSSGLGGMSGAQGKASVIAGAVGIIAEVNPKAIKKRHEQGWVTDVVDDLDSLAAKVEQARAHGTPSAIGYLGNIVDLWEYFAKSSIPIDLGSDQTSLHIPFTGGYYPVGLSFEQSNEMLSKDPAGFKEKVHESLRRQMTAINKVADLGMAFWDYGNAFLLEASRAGTPGLMKPDGRFTYPSYVEDIMGPMCFDYGFGPFRWVVTSCDPTDLKKTDEIAASVLDEMVGDAVPEMRQQLRDNLLWIRAAAENELVVGSQARILYSNAEGRIRIARAFNQAIRNGEITAPIVLGRDHHDVGGTDSPYRETADIYDGSSRCADMAVQNMVGDAFRGATWVSLHNGGGVGWGEVINGGFGMVLDGTEAYDQRIDQMMFWDVNNGIARRAWARNSGAEFTARSAMKNEPRLLVTLPHHANGEMVDEAIRTAFEGE